MTINQISYFLALAERLNFRAVAERFFISQPTLSRQIASIEQELGTQLFLRNNPNVELTPAGAAMYEEMSKVYARYEQAVDRVRKIGLRKHGHLAVALSEEQRIDNCVLDAIKSFSRLHPEIYVSIERAPYRRMRAGLLDCSFDVGNTMYLDGMYLSGCQNIKISEDNMCLAVNRELAEEYPREITGCQVLEIVARLPLTLISDEHMAYSAMPAIMLRNNLGVDLRDEDMHFTGDHFSTPIMVSAGLCVSIMNSTHVISGDPNIALLEIEGALPNIKVLSYKDSNPNPALPLFLKEFSKFMGGAFNTL